MSQISTPPIRRTGGNLDVYTGILLAALIVLASGVVLLGIKNSKHSESKPGRDDGGMFKLVDKR